MTGIERLRAAFAGGRRALVPYLTAGDPDLETTSALLEAVARGGADIIELGVPFSDPMADGPVLQKAAERALQQPFSLDAILCVAARFGGSAPIVLFGYYNPFFRYGHERLAAAAEAAGVAGILCVDLPPEEAGPLHDALAARGLALVPLVTPTSDAARLGKARAVASAFAYYVTLTGVTGAALDAPDTVAARVREVRAAMGLPVVVGFGVRTPEDARRVSEGADGVVVGSALVELCHRTPAEGRAAAAEGYVASLKAAL